MKLHPQQGERKGLMLSLVGHWLRVLQLCKLLITNTILHHSTKWFIVSLPFNSTNRILVVSLLPLIGKQDRAKYILSYILFVCYPSANGIFGKGQTQLTLKISIIFFFHNLYAKEQGNQRVKVFVIVSRYSRNCMVIENMYFHITVTMIRASGHRGRTQIGSGNMLN